MLSFVDPQHPDRTHFASFHSPSLEGNPLGARVSREMRVHLPPGYYAESRRYPVVYLLHGYGGDARHAIVETRDELNGAFPALFRFLLAGVFRRTVTMEAIDRLILRGVLPPFILVQPDGSLHLPQLPESTYPNGDPRLKGSMYFDSPGTGSFGSSAFIDAVDFVDQHYRTLPGRANRGVVGGSMGGYGALLAGILHPDRFAAVAALSPSICGLDVLDVELYVPFQRWLLGKRGAIESGRAAIADILETCDMIFSPDRPLMPTVVRGPQGKVLEMDALARANWAAADAGKMATSVSGAFKNVSLRVTCEEEDEFRFAEPNRRFAHALADSGIPHEAYIYRNRAAERISAHTVGIGLQVTDGLKFCLDHMVVSEP